MKDHEYLVMRSLFLHIGEKKRAQLSATFFEILKISMVE